MSTTENAAPKRSRWRLLAALVVMLLLAWAIAVAVTGLLAYRDLQAARDSAFAARAAVRDLELSTARSALEDGAQQAESASRRLRRPHLAPLRVLPFVSPNLRAVTTMSDAVRDVAGTGAHLLGLVVELTEDTSAGPDDQIPVDEFAEISPLAQKLAETLERTTREVEATSSGWLLGAVDEARRTYLELVGPEVEPVALAADAADAIPAFLGRDEPRRYLVGAGALSELRGTGGLFGSWSVLTARDGRLEFSDFADVEDLGEPSTGVTPPTEEFAERYRELGSLRFWRNANFTPHFPFAAQVWLELWEADGRPPLDGVILVDAVIFARLVEHSGPIEVAGVTTLRPGETVEFVGLDAYAAFEESDRRQQVLGAVATESFSRVLDALSGGDVADTMQVLSDLTDGGHLKVFSRHDGTQDVLERAGLAGGLQDVDGEFAAVFVNNLAANKVDYFTRRRIEHRVRLLPEGVTRSAVDVEFENAAPRTGYPRYVLGPWVEGVQAGDNLSEVTFVCGLECEIGPLAEGMRRATVLGRPAVDVRLRIPAGERRRVEYRTTTADGWEVEDGEVVVTVHHTVQPTLHGSTLRVVMDVPPGFRQVRIPDGAEFNGNEIVWEDVVSGDVRLEFRLAEEEADETPEP